MKTNKQERQQHEIYREQMNNFMKNSSSKRQKAGAGATTLNSIQFKRPRTSN